jgi:prepilin-type N-terminal cleavage/methylation domain-containing protein
MTSRHDVRGFTLLELIIVIAIIAIVAGMAVPTVMGASAQMRLSSATRQVERELQTARMRAVKSDRVIRVRFNCPVAGQYRMVELLGTVALPAADDAEDAAATRCSETSYPYPDDDPSFFAIPNSDGPIRRLPDGLAFQSVKTIDFWPNGTAHDALSPMPLAADATLQVYDVEKGTTFNRSITVNSLGKITFQQ